LSELAEHFIHQVDELIESLLEQALFCAHFAQNIWAIRAMARHLTLQNG